MTDREIDNLIDWCRQKIAREKADPFGLSGKRLEGYEQAMRAVMSHLHTEKEQTKRRTRP